MQRIEDANAGTSRCIEDLLHVRNALVGFGDVLQAIPHLAAFGDEVVVRVDHQQAGDALVVGNVGHGSLVNRIEVAAKQS
jgi:hypothetical protein